MASELLTNLCDKYIISLLEEKEGKEIDIVKKGREDILRKIRYGYWDNVEKRNTWVFQYLYRYLMYYSMCSILDWINDSKEEWISESLTKFKEEQYREEINDIRFMLNTTTNANDNTIILKFYYHVILSKSPDELLEYLDILLPEVCPK